MHRPKGRCIFVLYGNGGGGASLLFINSKMRRTAPGLMVYNIVNLTKI